MSYSAYVCFFIIVSARLLLDISLFTSAFNDAALFVLGGGGTSPRLSLVAGKHTKYVCQPTPVSALPHPAGGAPPATTPLASQSFCR